MTDQIPSIDEKNIPVGADTTVLGQVMLAFTENLRADEVRPILQEFGISEIDAQTWYPQAVFVKIYAAMEEQGNGENIVAIGMKTVDVLEFPAEVTDIMGALQVLPAMYQQIHQNIPDDEGWRIEQVAPNDIRVTFQSPYSDYAAYGYLYSIARRFKPAGTQFTVTPKTFASGGPAVFEIVWS